MIEEALKQVANFGFPIVMSLLLFYALQVTMKDNTKATRELVTFLKGRMK